jgi:hypothetical protein
MMRTTLDIDTPILEELKRLQMKGDGGRKSMGKMVSELLAEALSRREGEVAEVVGFDWIAKPMRLLVNLDDKEAVYAALDQDR